MDQELKELKELRKSKIQELVKAMDKFPGNKVELSQKTRKFLENSLKNADLPTSITYYEAFTEGFMQCLFFGSKYDDLEQYKEIAGFAMGALFMVTADQRKAFEIAKEAMKTTHEQI
jgi:hypothetical protein